MNKKYVNILLIIFWVLTEFTNTQQVITENRTGEINGYSYELWKDTGITKMTLLGGAKFKCEWNNINKSLCRIGKKWDCSKTWAQLENIFVTYDVDYRPNGISYLGVYGWFKSPLIEYYIIESWGSWRPPVGSDSGLRLKETINIDDDTYDIYVNDKMIRPEIDDSSNFKQIWSVRNEKRTSGTISVSDHFKAWEVKGNKLGLLDELSFIIEGYQSSGTATVKYLEIKGG